jgi:general secretion pathway protein A
MIRYRLTQAGEPDDTPTLFTFPGLLAVYLATGGYPRKIITLCHQVILAIIIQNRSRAGWFLVRACGARLASAGRTWPLGSLRWVTGVSIVVAAVFLFMTLRTPTNGSIVAPAPLRQEAAQRSAVVEKSVSEVPVIPDAVLQSDDTRQIKPQAAALEDPALHQQPSLLGKLALKNGRTIWWMLTDFYGVYDPGIFRSVATANPHIRNLSRVQAGEMIHLPALPVKGTPLPGRYWVQILASGNLEETYEFFRTQKEGYASLRFLPYWNPRQGVVFSILLKDGFPDETSARQKIAALPASLASRAAVINRFEENTVFYTR